MKRSMRNLLFSMLLVSTVSLAQSFPTKPSG